MPHTYIQGKTVIQHVAFTLPTAAIIGLIGGNGAGKSTTIQAMLGTLPHANVTHTLPTMFGYVPERPILYEYYTLREHIELLIQTIDAPNDELWARTYALCETFKLYDKLDHYPIQYSIFKRDAAKGYAYFSVYTDAFVLYRR